MAAPGGRRAGSPSPPWWLRVGPLLAVLLLAGPPRAGAGAVNRIASPGLAVAAAIAAGLAGGAAGITLDEFRASWARSPQFPRTNDINFSGAPLTAYDFSLDLCAMETWENRWQDCPATYWREVDMNDNHVPWASGDRERCEYCGFFVRSPVFYFPPGTYKFIISNMQYKLYVRALTATGRASYPIGELLVSLDFGAGLDRYKKTATLVVETGDFYRFTASTTVSATPPGPGIKVWEFTGDTAAWEYVTPQGWDEPNVTVAVTRDDLTCDFDAFTAPDCSTVVTISNSGPVPANVTFASTSGAFSYSPPAAVLPADQGQLTATVAADVTGLAPGFHDDRLVLLTQETVSCRGEGVAFTSVVDGYTCERLIANVTLGVQATGQLAHLPPSAAWNCSIGPGSTFCPDIQLSLTNPGNASLAWKAVFDGQNIHVTPSRGEIAPRATTVAVVDVQEARFPPGQHLETVEILTSALRHHCTPGGLLGPNVPPSHENFTCSAQTVPVAVEAALTSGLVAYPGVLQIDLPLDTTRDASVSAIYAEVENSVPYRVDLDPACGAGLAVTSSAGGSGAPLTLVRLVPDQINFRLEGRADVAAFNNFNGTVVACGANITRLDDEVRRLPLVFNVTARPGRPSAASTLAADPAAPMAGTAATFTIRGFDRLGNPCDRVWEDVQTRFAAIDALSGEETELGGGVPLSGKSGAGVFRLALGEVPLSPGAYRLRGYLSMGAGDETPLTQEPALEVVPIECPKNGESAARTGTVCECAAGFGGDAAGTGCGSCPAGAYKAEAGNYACIGCPGGATTRGGGSQAVEDCLCPIGSFLSGDGVSAGCTPCVAVLGEGSSTPDIGATSQDDCRCEAVYYRNADGICTECPPGARCNGGYAPQMELKTGFWRSASSSEQLHGCDAPRGVHLCTGGKIESTEALDVGNEVWPSDDLCREGHRGAMCWECVGGYGKRLGVCEKCGGTSGAMGQSVAFVFLGAVFFVAAMLGLSMQSLGRVMKEAPGAAREKKDANLTVGVLKILITWLQLASLANSVRVPFGPEMKELLKWEDLGNVSPWSFSSFNCAVQVSFYARFYMTVFAPLMSLPLGALLTALLASVARRKGWATLYERRDAFIMTVEMILFLSYTMVNNVTLSVFKCRELDEGLFVLAADPSVVCGTKAHKGAVGVGVLSVICLTLGVPLQAFAQMYFYRRRGRLQDTGMRIRYGFFFANYRETVYWYECFGMLRKATVVATVVLLQDKVGLQVFTVTLVAIVFLTMHTYFKPYEEPLLNKLETLALFVSTCTLSSCTFFYATRQNGVVERGYEITLCGAIILMSVGLLGLCAFVIGQDVRKHFYLKKGGDASLGGDALGGAGGTGKAAEPGMLGDGLGIWASTGRSSTVIANPLVDDSDGGEDGGRPWAYPPPPTEL